MIERKELLALGYYRSAAFCGSDGGMRYRIRKGKEVAEEQETVFFEVHYWPGPYAFDATPPEEIQSFRESFDEEGLCRVAQRLSELQPQFGDKSRTILEAAPYQAET